MMEDFEHKAREQSIMDLIAAMDEDEVGRIPAIKSAMGGGEEMDPLLSISISAAGGEEMPKSPETEETPQDKFSALLKRKMRGA